MKENNPRSRRKCFVSLTACILAAALLTACAEKHGETPTEATVITTQPEATGGAEVETLTDYKEKYRGQFHFSPVYGWAGDPDGLIHYEGKYHLFWWGKATSTDLVHFDQVTIGRAFALTGDPGLGDYFTGGAVIDKNNTAGFGAGAMIPIYTIPSTPQKQCISYSLDDTMDTFGYYEGNPVLEREGTNDFRDPTVFWHEQSGCWIMVIAVPLEHKVAFYRSDNLKDWTWLSDFGQIGAQSAVWECPDLVQLPMEDGSKKWVLLISVGPNKVQYFVGDFDGTQFVLDPAVEAYLNNGTGLDGQVFADFNSPDHGWTLEGKAFETAGNSQHTQKGLGGGLLDTGTGGDDLTGTLTSPEFVIEKNAINFLIAGGAHPKNLVMQLLIDGEAVRTAVGDGTFDLNWYGWDVSDLKGKTAQIRIVDNYRQTPGSLLVDQIVFSDTLMNTRREHALWVDYGMDFYAPRTVRDYDGTLEDVQWLGWMGNWDYANVAPALKIGDKDLRGVWSIARSLRLTTVNGVPRLTQTPLEALKQLRNSEFSLSTSLAAGTQTLKGFQPEINSYEFEATFQTQDDNEFGLNLCVGDGRKLTVGYNTKTSNLYIDRTNCADTDIKHFAAVMSAPLAAKDGKITLHGYVDKNSVEIFSADGTCVLTMLTYAADDQTGIELFSEKDGVTAMEFTAWNLDSIWPGHIQAAPVEVDDGDARLQYEGSWTAVSDDEAYQNANCHVTDSGSVTLEFAGTAVDWYGLVNSNLGMAEVYIDGKLDRVVDCYSPTRRLQKLYSKTQLMYGIHTITVKAIPDKNAASADSAVVHDRFVYLPWVQ